MLIATLMNAPGWLTASLGQKPSCTRDKSAPLACSSTRKTNWPTKLPQVAPSDALK